MLLIQPKIQHQRQQAQVQHSVVSLQLDAIQTPKHPAEDGLEVAVLVNTVSNNDVRGVAALLLCVLTIKLISFDAKFISFDAKFII